MKRIAICILLFWTAASAQAQEVGWAAKMFKIREHNFGPVARGAKAEYGFELQNIYEEDVHIVSVSSSCGCTTPSIDKQTLQTWEKARVNAKFNTRSFLGQRSATITVVIDQPFYAEVQLAVSGYIRSDVVFEPGEVNFGEVDQFSPSEIRVKVDYAGRDDWKIVDVRSANPHFEVQLFERNRDGNRVRYEMVVGLKSDAPAGYFHDQLTLVTDDARLKRIPLAVQGRIVSPLTLSPGALLLGTLQPGESVTKQLVVRGKKPFKVTGIHCPDGCFSFSDLPEDSKKLHLIPVTFTAGDDAGKVFQKIEIETDLGATVQCSAQGLVRETVGGE